MKRPETRLRDLRKELHYWQMMARMEQRWMLSSMEHCRRVGKDMRAAQRELKPKIVQVHR